MGSKSVPYEEVLRRLLEAAKKLEKAAEKLKPSPRPLSDESLASVKKGLEDAAAGRVVDLGSFAKYATDEDDE